MSFFSFFSEVLNECRANLIDREHSHHVYAQTPVFVFSFHEIGDKVTLRGIAAILPKLRFFIQQYVGFVDYFGSLYCQRNHMHARLASYQGTWQDTEICQPPLAA